MASKQFTCVLLAALCSACAYHSPDAPTPIIPEPSTAPATIRLVSGTRADRTTDIVATVLTERGAFVVGSRVDFATSAGSLSVTSGISDAQGTVHSILTSGENATVRASMAGLTSSIDVPGQPSPAEPTPSPAPPAPPAPPLPTPSATVNGPSTATTGASVTFSIASTSIGQAWSWSFGDGTTAQSSAFTIAHTYTAAGAYTVTVSSPATVSGRALVITVSDPTPVPTPAPPTPALTLTLTCPTPTGHAIVCNLAGTDETGAIVTTTLGGTDWDFGDGSPHNMTFTTLANYTYAQAGTYIVAVSAVGPGGRRGSTQKSVTIP